MTALRTGVITLGILGASVWIGSLVCLAAVSSVARRELTGTARVALFRGVGRIYRVVGTSSLLVSIAVGLLLAWPVTEVSTTVGVMFVLSGALLVVTALGMEQAHRMSVARQRLLVRPKDEEIAETVRHGSAVAGALRGSLGVITLIIVVLGAGLLGR